MITSLDMAVRLAANTARVGWFYGVNRLMERAFRPRDGKGGDPVEITRPVPTRKELFADLRDLVIADADDARRGIHRALEWPPTGLPAHLKRLRAMLRDVPLSTERRLQGVHDTVRDYAGDRDWPDYYAQDFHFQTGGHLAPDSARLYDVQVETLFYGSADVMRRRALRPIHDALTGRDQRHLTLLDVACGTGRFLRDVRLTYPRLNLAGLDLSPAYLSEARHHLRDLRPADLIEANAEVMPLDPESCDVVTSVFLFHELPPGVRSTVAGEIARVLKPGGVFILVDSLQFGDRPDWDGLLEGFPQRFHEPYYRQYLIDDLEARFETVGLAPADTALAFLSKVMTFRKPKEPSEEVSNADS
jgi:ubiquinone/menaquinone biosynthesis C-methylase UbiE